MHTWFIFLHSDIECDVPSAHTEFILVFMALCGLTGAVRPHVADQASLIIMATWWPHVSLSSGLAGYLDVPSHVDVLCHTVYIVIELEMAVESVL